MSHPIPRIAVVGCGQWGRNIVRCLDHLGALALVCDPREEARDLARRISPAARVSEEAAHAVADREINGVIVATPPASHGEIALEALRHGKDVLVEKPLALDPGHARRLAEEAEARGLVLMVGHVLEYHPAVTRLRELVADGECGRLRYVYSNRLSFGRVRSAESALWSFAPHDVALILRLLGGMPLEVTCVGGSYLNAGIADLTLSTMRFGSGARGHILVSWLHPFKEQRLVVIGDRRMAVFTDSVREGKLVLFDQRVRFDDDHEPILENGGARSVGYGEEEPLLLECRHFLECIATRSRPLTDAASGIAVLDVLQACEESMELDGRPVALHPHLVAGAAARSSHGLAGTP